MNGGGANCFCVGNEPPYWQARKATRLRRGDVATVVEHHPGRPGQEPGYTLEVFNAVGETVDVVTVPESQIEPLTADELLTVRPLEPAAP